MAQINLNLVPNSYGQFIYYTSETIKGALTVILSKETKCKALFVTLIGEAIISVDDETSMKKRIYYHKKNLDHENRFSSHGDFVRMSPGTYEYQFSYELPQGLPRSYASKLIYKVEGSLDVSWKLMKKTFQQFELRRIDNLNLYPILSLPRVKHLDTNFFNFSFNCGSNGTFRLTVSLSCSGFVPGQIIKLKLKYENLSNAKIKRTEIALIQTEFERYDEKRLNNRTSFIFIKNYVEGVNARDTKEVDCDLPIPINTLQSDFLYSKVLTILHAIQITSITDYMHLNPKFIIPIVIGSIPLVINSNGLQTSIGIDNAIMCTHLAKNKF